MERMTHFLKRRLVRLTAAAIAAAASASIVVLTAGPTQDAPRIDGSVLNDWTHRHLIFSGARSATEAQRLQDEPRYRHQWLLHNRGAGPLGVDATVLGVQTGAPMWDSVSAAAPNEALKINSRAASPQIAAKKHGPPTTVRQDWAMSLGAGAQPTPGYPAKFTLDVTATPSCVNDFVVFNENSPSTGLAGIIAFNNLYSTQSATLQGLCGGAGPSLMWAYRTTSTPGGAVTSPVLSLDGTKVMYVESRTNPNGGSVLHILRWQANQGTVTTPVLPNLVVTNWNQCTAGNSCVVDIPFNGAQNASLSAAFYDYTNDALYAGDDTGVLHKFAPVLSGAPAEVIGAGWPITVHSGAPLSPPVLDPGSNRIFVVDSQGVSYVTASGVPAVGGFVALVGAVQAPMVDSSAGKVYTFSSASAGGVGCGGTPCFGRVDQFSTSLSSQVTVTDIGASASGPILYPGTFDHQYLTSPSGTGSLFLCGQSNTGPNRAAIHRISITNGVMSTTSDGTGLMVTSSGGGQCSPVTELYNATTGLDWLFFSVPVGSNQGGGCDFPNTNGCLMSLDVTGTAWPPAAVTAGYHTSGATSGIVVDNVGGSTTVPSTRLNNAITNATTGLTVSSTGGFGVGDYIRIDAENMQIVTVNSGTQLTVTRAQLGTSAASHLVNTAVTDLRVTLLIGPHTAAATILSVDSTTTFKINDYVQIDAEAMLVTAKGVTTLTVTRAQLGSTAISHSNDAVVSDLSPYPQAASIYFQFRHTGTSTATCNGTSAVGCAAKLTQNGLQ